MSLSTIFGNPVGDLEKFLENLVKELDVPDERYEQAESSYHSVGDWLGREKSTLREFNPNVYIQGSFRLGTAIRPFNDSDHYDVDLVCELEVAIGKTTQAKLKQLFLDEMAAYAESKRMEPPSEGRRCVTLNYREGAQFHLDVLPAVPDSVNKRIALALESLDAGWVESAIAITDKDHPAFDRQTEKWPHSNPKGFAEWFKKRMSDVFLARRAAIALEAHANVEDIPEHRVKTPLQAAVQILKRHRDWMFKDRQDDKPISIIISTLAARAYKSEATISAALSGVIGGMEHFIEQRNGVLWIENPTDPQENFADRWATHPERKDAFFEWLAQAKSDLATLASQSGRRLLAESSHRWAGDAGLRAGGLATGQGAAQTFIAGVGRALRMHQRKSPWPSTYRSGSVQLTCQMTRNGFRPDALQSNAPALPKFVGLRFTAVTDVQGPYEVHWQVVNTGEEAERAGDLRGDFDKGVVEKGEIVHKETTHYRGSHTIECFIVQNSYLVASSGQFVVNVS